MTHAISLEPVEMTAATMDELEDKGLIIRLCPGRHRLPAKPGDGERQVTSASARNRVNRGGSFYRAARFARSAYRSASTPEFRDYDVGVRPSRSLEP